MLEPATHSSLGLGGGQFLIHCRLVLLMTSEQVPRGHPTPSLPALAARASASKPVQSC